MHAYPYIFTHAYACVPEYIYKRSLAAAVSEGTKYHFREICHGLQAMKFNNEKKKK